MNIHGVMTDYLHKTRSKFCHAHKVHIAVRPSVLVTAGKVRANNNNKINKNKPLEGMS